jgi:hypothetical protein
MNGLSTEDYERCSQLIEAALAHDPGTHTVADVWAMIDSGEAIRLVVNESVAVIQFLQTPLRKEVLVWLAAGDMTDMPAIADMVCAMGKMEGCAVALFRGRRGWERSFLVRDDGWLPTHVTYMKELRDDRPDPS